MQELEVNLGPSYGGRHKSFLTNLKKKVQKKLPTMAAKWLADQARKTFQPTEVEEKLKEALSKKNYGTAKSILNEIARYTFDYSQYNVVMEAVWKAINQKGKNWRVVFKGLELMDHLIKNGAERVVDECRERIYTIRTLTEFQYHEDRKDKGAGVRQMAKTVVAMLNDTDMIRTERAKARKLRGFWPRVAKTLVNYKVSGPGMPKPL